MAEQMIKILLVDDDKYLLRMVCVSLKSSRCEVITASGGENALEMIDKGLVPDIVLLDIAMPGMDGFEAFRLMRERQALEHVPIVFLTSLTGEKDKVKGLDMGAADYLTKPFEAKVMARRVPMYIEAARARRKLREIEKSGVILINEDKFASVTSRLTVLEKEIVCLAVNGKSNSEIGEKLLYSNSYVKKRMCCIYDKLGVNNRNELKEFFASSQKAEEISALVII